MPTFNSKMKEAILQLSDLLIMFVVHSELFYNSYARKQAIIKIEKSKGALYLIFEKKK